MDAKELLVKNDILNINELMDASTAVNLELLQCVDLSLTTTTAINIENRRQLLPQIENLVSHQLSGIVNELTCVHAHHISICIHFLSIRP